LSDRHHKEGYLSVSLGIGSAQRLPSPSLNEYFVGECPLSTHPPYMKLQPTARAATDALSRL